VAVALEPPLVREGDAALPWCWCCCCPGSVALEGANEAAWEGEAERPPHGVRCS
jgi:hypothetical protein